MADKILKWDVAFIAKMLVPVLRTEWNLELKALFLGLNLDDGEILAWTWSCLRKIG